MTCPLVNFYKFQNIDQLQRFVLCGSLSKMTDSMDDATARWKAKSAAYQKSVTLMNRKTSTHQAILIVGIWGILILNVCVLTFNIGHYLEEYSNAFLPKHLHVDAEHIKFALFMAMLIFILMLPLICLDRFVMTPDKKDFTDPLVAIDTCELIRRATLLTYSGTYMCPIWKSYNILKWIDNGIISSEHQEALLDLKKRYKDNNREIEEFKDKYPHALQNSAKVRPFFEEVRQNLAKIDEEWAQLHAIIVSDLPDPEICTEDIMKFKE